MSEITPVASYPQHLALLGKGDCAIVRGLSNDGDAGDQSAGGQSALRLRLLELGFAPGEKIRVMAVSFPQGDPMAVRVGNSIFALRRHEAAMVQLMPPDTLA